MTTWNPRANELFLAALEFRSLAERQAYLDAACSGDQTLRAEVEALLEASNRAGSFLESPAAIGSSIPDQGESPPLVATEEEQRNRPLPDNIVGSYKLLERIGEGGFGFVYMAEQAEPVRRKVALKILKPGMDTKQVVARFEAERQALAIMDHPNIARVFDGGETVSGLPYFVMELVKGVPITQYCDQNHLTPQQRLQLFLQVCHAVQHAHQKGIIHRDIKPSNILVSMHDTIPVVKVIDFGVAKALGQELTDKTIYTGFAQMIGTPLYMSPEQAGQSGLDIDTRSDIYSMGVLLYELLTGTTPFSKDRFKQAAYDEIRRIIREEEPPKPSTRLSDSKDSLPSISASRQMEPTRLKKLVRGELDWIVMKSLEKDRNRRYETANSFAMDIQRYLADEPVQACSPSAGYRLRKFIRRNKRVLSTTVLLGTALLVTVGTIAGSIGWASRDRAAREAAAENEAELALKEADQRMDKKQWLEAQSAIKRAEGLLALGGNEALSKRASELRRDVEMVLHLEEIRLQFADGSEKGKAFDTPAVASAYVQAFRDYGIDVEAISISQSAELIRLRPVAVELALALDVWAWMDNSLQRSFRDKLTSISRAADPDESRDRVRAVLFLPKDQRKGALKDIVAANRNRTLPAITLRILGIWLRSVGLTDEAIIVFHDAQIRYPGDFWINFDLAWTLNEKKPLPTEEVIRYYTAALALRPGSIGTLYNLSRAYFKHGDLDRAELLIRRAIELNPKYINGYDWLARLLEAKGRSDEARVTFLMAIKVDPNACGILTNLGLLYLNQLKNTDEAMACFQKAIAINAGFAPAHSGLGTCFYKKGQVKEAIASYQKAIELDRKFVFAQQRLADIWIQQDRLDDAIKILREGLISEQNNASCHASLGQALVGKGLTEEAMVHYKKAIDINPKYAFAFNGLGEAVEASTKPNERVDLHWNKAIDYYRKAIELDPTYHHAHWNLARLLRYQNVDEAIVHLKTAIGIKPTALYHTDLALAFEQKQQVSEAIVELGKAIRLDPNEGRPHLHMANIRREQGWPEAERARYRKASEIGLEDPQLNLALAHDLKRIGDLDRALLHYQKATETKTEPIGKSVAYYWLGRAQLQKGLWDEAIASFKQGIQIHARLGLPYQYAQDLAIIPSRRDPIEAVRLAQALIEVTPAGDKRVRQAWQVLAWGRYRLGDYKEAIVAINKVKELGSPGDSFEWFLLAFAHKKLGNAKEAREWYDKAVDWMTKNHPKHYQLGLLRVEGRELFGEPAEYKFECEVAPPPREKP